MMGNTKPEIPIFAVDNAADCEQFLFLNHPTTFVSLTSDTKDEHHSPPTTPTLPKSILKHCPLHNVTFAPNAAAPPMERRSSTTSATSTDSSDSGFLGGGALRHAGGSHHHEHEPEHHEPHHHRGNAHHLQELAELAALDRQAKARRSLSMASASSNQKVQRRPKEEGGLQQQDWLASVLAWWPEQMECMEHEWTEEFYE
jgi:hypothetical protein